MRLVTGALIAMLVTTDASSCSESPDPPPNVGTLIVHALSTWGPVDSNGHSAGEQVLTETEVIARAANGVSAAATTDESGDARLMLAPGRYAVRLASDKGCFGFPDTERVQVFAHRQTHVQVGCDGP